MDHSMSESFRSFTVGPDSFGRTWQVDFAWLQTGTSIRHADTVDVKFFLSNGPETQEKIVALPHPDLVAVAAGMKREVTDSWCSAIAARHVREMIETGEDIEKTLVTLSASRLRRHAEQLVRTAVGA